MVLLDTGTPFTSREIYRENAECETQTHNTLSYEQGVLAIELNSSIAVAGKEFSLSSWCIASLIFINSQLWLTSHPRSINL